MWWRTASQLSLDVPALAPLSPLLPLALDLVGAGWLGRRVLFRRHSHTILAQIRRGGTLKSRSGCRPLRSSIDQALPRVIEGDLAHLCGTDEGAALVALAREQSPTALERPTMVSTSGI